MISAVIYLIGVWSRALGFGLVPVLDGLGTAIWIELIFEFVVFMMVLNIKEQLQRGK